MPCLQLFPNPELLGFLFIKVAEARGDEFDEGMQLIVALVEDDQTREVLSCSLTGRIVG